MSHSGETSGISCEVTFFSSRGGQAWSVTTTSNFPVGMSKGGKNKVKSVFTDWVLFLRGGGSCTRAVLVWLEVSDRRSSTHGHQLSPELRWLLKHEEDTQRLEGAAARMPERGNKHLISDDAVKPAKAKEVKSKATLLTTPRWHHPAPRRLAAGSSCSSAACSLCSSLSPRYETRRARRWPNTAGTSWCGSAGLQ